MKERLTQNQIEPVIRLFSENQYESALNLINKLIQRFPEDSILFNIKGLCLQALNSPDLAISEFNKAVSLDQNNAQAHFNLGVHFHSVNENEIAMKHYKKALKILPEFPNVHNNIGLILMNDDNLSEAIKHFEKAINFDPKFSEAHNNLGATLQKNKKIDGAIQHFKKAIEINPNYDQAYNNLGIMFQSLGDEKNAKKNFENALIVNPSFISAHMNLSNVKRYDSIDAQVTQMLDLISKKPNRLDEICLSFSLAKVFDDLGEIKEQFKYLNNGNILFKEKLKYSIQDDFDHLSIVKRFFEDKSETIDTLSSEEAPKKTPIFIIGLPRSGTTLVEQILSSHSDVYGADEISYFGNQVSDFIEKNITSNSTKLTGKALIEIRKNYFEEINNFEFNENKFTDKMHMNYRYTGFILSAFPEAKIVHLKRDARATCWSIYKHFFSDTKNGWAYDMIDIAEYFNFYTDMMSFWHNLYPNKIYDISYEDLTTNQEEETRKLLEYCDLEWDENCLNFHNNERAVKTASALQVRKKMYQGSSEAWKKYESYLKPMLNKLN